MIRASQFAGSSPSSPGQGTSGQSQAPATNAGMYLYSYSVGTPPQSVSGALDISSELVWTQCSCATCDADAGHALLPSPVHHDGRAAVHEQHVPGLRGADVQRGHPCRVLLHLRVQRRRGEHHRAPRHRGVHVRREPRRRRRLRVRPRQHGRLRRRAGRDRSRQGPPLPRLPAPGRAVLLLLRPRQLRRLRQLHPLRRRRRAVSTLLASSDYPLSEKGTSVPVTVSFSAGPCDRH
jgi:hypothetical protein